MQPIIHIVATTDFSATAERAVQRAALIAKQLNAELHLLHVVHPLDLHPGSELSFGSQRHFEQSLQETSKNQLDTLTARLHDQFGIPVRATTRIGRAHTQIASYAASHTGSLIVAGSRGENAMLDLLLGSTASRLLRVANCPVLIVKNAEVNPYQQVIAAVDFSAGSAEVPALARAVAPNAHIEALLIFDTNQEVHINKAGINETLLQQHRDSAQAEVEKRLNEIVAEQGGGERMTRKILPGYPSESICARAKMQQADLIVIGRHSKSDMENWLLGSVSKGVASAAKCDVLLLNPHRETQKQ